MTGAALDRANVSNKAYAKWITGGDVRWLRGGPAVTEAF